MVSGVTVGKRVKALATKAKSEGWCKGKWPRTWKAEFLTGTVVEKVERNWRVEWDPGFGAGSSVIFARHLEWAVDDHTGDAAASMSMSTSVSSAAASRPITDPGRQQISMPDPPRASTGSAAGSSDATPTNTSDDELDEDDGPNIDNPPFDDTEAAAAADPGSDPLKPHGTKWTRVQGIPIQPQNMSSTRAKLIWPDHGQTSHKGPLEFFMLFFPTSFLERTLELTSVELAGAGRRPISENELYLYVGLMLVASLFSSMPLEEVFRGVDDGYTFDVSPRLDQFMPFTRFKYIGKCMKFATPSDSPADRERRGDFWAIQPLIDSFNACRRAVFVPGPKLVVGESFCPWCGRDEKHHVKGCPHVQKEKRKPMGVGMELKNVACVTVGVLLCLEIVASTDEMHHREHWKPQYASTALMLRLLAPFAGSGRVVLGGSAFASVQTATALFKLLGLFFIGIVKSCTRWFPFKWTQEYNYRHRGDHVALTATHDGVDVRAVGWGDKKVKSFIATCGTTLQGTPHEKRRWRNDNDGTTQYFTREVPRPNIVEEYYDGAQTIDVHNHIRRGAGLGLEMRPTNRWEMRFFQTFVGMIEVDAYLAFKYFRDPNAVHRTFIKAVAWGLIQKGLAVGQRRQSPSTRPSGGQRSPASNHTLKSLSNSRYYVRRSNEAVAQNKSTPIPALLCRICHNRTSYFCLQCSDQTDNTKSRGIHAVCAPSRRHGRTCFEDHISDANVVCASSSDQATVEETPPPRARARV